VLKGVRIRIVNFGLIFDRRLLRSGGLGLLGVCSGSGVSFKHFLRQRLPGRAKRSQDSRCEIRCDI